jgi:hypothetical protein
MWRFPIKAAFVTVLWLYYFVSIYVSCMMSIGWQRVGGHCETMPLWLIRYEAQQHTSALSNVSTGANLVAACWQCYILCAAEIEGHNENCGSPNLQRVLLGD